MNESLLEACMIKLPGIGMGTFAGSLGHVAAMLRQPASTHALQMENLVLQ